MKRSEAREKLMQLIFQMDAQDDYTQGAADEFKLDFMPGSDQSEYFDAVLNAYIENKVDINKKIKAAAKGWRMEYTIRMAWREC